MDYRAKVKLKKNNTGPKRRPDVDGTYRQEFIDKINKYKNCVAPENGEPSSRSAIVRHLTDGLYEMADPGNSDEDDDDDENDDDEADPDRVENATGFVDSRAEGDGLPTDDGVEAQIEFTLDDRECLNSQQNRPVRTASFDDDGNADDMTRALLNEVDHLSSNSIHSGYLNKYHFLDAENLEALKQMCYVDATVNNIVKNAAMKHNQQFVKLLGHSVNKLCAFLPNLIDEKFFTVRRSKQNTQHASIYFFKSDKLGTRSQCEFAVNLIACDGDRTLEKAYTLLFAFLFSCNVVELGYIETDLKSTFNYLSDCKNLSYLHVCIRKKCFIRLI